MPDRAVVDDTCVPAQPVLICPRCEGEKQTIKDHGSWVEDVDCSECDGKGYLPQPRALVALSDDRQWLVVLSPLGDKWIGLRWHFFGEYYRSSPKSGPPWDWEDTGQDAHEVLAQFLQERAG